MPSESLDTLDQDFQPPIPTNCDIGTWFGARPTLALDGAGNPRIGYDGEWVVGNNAACQPAISYRSVRWTFFPQP
ncbi:MAG: hypothetical protein H0X37_18655 [Herpetosiphonaceae bacterium]|nr:hypothetical protein [Herpetosiphonaceae bacterium]